MASNSGSSKGNIYIIYSSREISILKYQSFCIIANDFPPVFPYCILKRLDDTQHFQEFKREASILQYVLLSDISSINPSISISISTSISISISIFVSFLFTPVLGLPSLSHRCSRLNHPNVVRFLGIYLNNSSNEEGVLGIEQYIVAEYLPRGSLVDTLQKEKDSLTISQLLGM